MRKGPLLKSDPCQDKEQIRTNFFHRLRSQPLFPLRLCCLEQFYVYNKVEREVQIFPIYPYLYTCSASSIINITHQHGTYSTKDEDEPTLTHHPHSQSIIHISVLPPFKSPLELETPFSYVMWRFIHSLIHTPLAHL